MKIFKRKNKKEEKLKSNLSRLKSQLTQWIRFRIRREITLSKIDKKSSTDRAISEYVTSIIDNMKIVDLFEINEKKVPSLLVQGEIEIHLDRYRDLSFNIPKISEKHNFSDHIKKIKNEIKHLENLNTKEKDILISKHHEQIDLTLQDILQIFTYFGILFIIGGFVSLYLLTFNFGLEFSSMFSIASAFESSIDLLLPAMLVFLFSYLINLNSILDSISTSYIIKNQDDNNLKKDFTIKLIIATLFLFIIFFISAVNEIEGWYFNLSYPIFFILLILIYEYIPTWLLSFSSLKMKEFLLIYLTIVFFITVIFTTVNNIGNIRYPGSVNVQNYKVIFDEEVLIIPRQSIIRFNNNGLAYFIDGRVIVLKSNKIQRFEIIKNE